MTSMLRNEIIMPWIVEYADPNRLSLQWEIWKEFDTEEEAYMEAERMRKHWRSRVIPPEYQHDR